MKAYLFIAMFLTCLALAPKMAAATFSPRQEPLSVSGITFLYENQKFTASAETVNSWRGPIELPAQSSLMEAPVDPSSYIKNFYGEQVANLSKQTYFYNPASVFHFISEISGQINQAPQEPELTITDNRVTAFTPPEDGVLVDSYDTVFNTISAITQNSTSVPVSVSIAKPTKSLTETNNLGINELIGHGVSSFKGSPNNRRHNIKVGVEKETGIVVPQGAEFSFNDNLGPVEAETGFLPELVIKADKGTIPEFGGGLCQVSSTTFRAAMDAGLPIIQRRNHSYAVQYYAPQGTDATIYPGVIDLKFTNDTPGAILIWPYFTDKDTLVFDIYGTKDGRKVTLEKPVAYDKKTDGSMKATWTRLVTSVDGQERTDVFKSTYLPPALFHKTESFASASSTPAATVNEPTTRTN